MVRRRQQITTLVLVSIAAIGLVALAYMLGRARQPAEITVPEIAFRESTGLALTFSSESVPAGAVALPASQSDLEDRTFSVQYLTDGRFMLAGYPDCFYFLDDGTQDGHLVLQPPDADMFISAGIDPVYATTVVSTEDLAAISATESGTVWGVFNNQVDNQKDNVVLQVVWSPDGNPTSVSDIGPALGEISEYLDERFGSLCISTFHEQVLMFTSDGGFMLHEQGKEPVCGIMEYLLSAYGLSGSVHGGGFYTGSLGSLITRHDFDGTIDWEWLINTTDFLQPEILERESWTALGLLRRLAFHQNGNALMPIQEGVIEIDAQGNAVRYYGDSQAAQNYARRMLTRYNPTYIIPEPKGWILYSPRLVEDKPLLHLDKNFNTISEVEFKPAFEESERETLADFRLQIGDFAYPELVYPDFRPTPSGFRAVDFTYQRVLAMNLDLEVTSVFDRTDPPNGLTQAIHVYREDSRGVKYILDTELDLIQVLDPDGNYIRRHTELGLDLFGGELHPMDMTVDALDRLWIIGKDRIYVLDREGNLQRIFERRGAPYQRPQAPPGPRLPTESTPRGYTIYASSDPFLQGPDPTVPITLDIDSYKGVIVASRGPGMPVLMYFDERDADRISILDWEGRERGTIDIPSLTPSSRPLFMVGPDGYCYYMCTEHEEIIVLEPLGDEVTRIEVEDLPEPNRFWYSRNQSIFSPPGYYMIKRCFIDYDGQLVISTVDPMEILVYPLRAE